MASSATDSGGKDKEIREKIVKTGHVDVMISVGNNFFYTLSLPCSLWFFDKAKREENKDKVLFIDARNYYTVVDRTLNEWSDWQLRNLQAIVHLYRGDKESYKQLVRDYVNVLANVTDPPTNERLKEIIRNGETEFSTRFTECLEQQKEEAKKEIADASRKEKKQIEADWNETITHWEELIETAKQFEWLTEKFGEGEYKDIPGLCKIESVTEIEAKNYSLTPGAYVGVLEQEDDGVDFSKRMNEIHNELKRLRNEADVLMGSIRPCTKGNS